jgi:hypothetical protein
MEMSALRGLYLHKQVHYDDKGGMTVMTPKYNHTNDCSKDTPVCSKVMTVT